MSRSDLLTAEDAAYLAGVSRKLSDRYERIIR